MEHLFEANQLFDGVQRNPFQNLRFIENSNREKKSTT